MSCIHVSDTGTTRPESCVFGFFLAWTGFMAAAVFYVRFKQVHLTLKGDGCCKVVNDLAFLVGLLASIGMVMVSAFQEYLYPLTHTTVLANYATSYIFADGVNHLHWVPGDDGYVNHICSTISEWIVALTFLLFITSFYKEFKSCKFEFKVCLNRTEQSPIFGTPQTYGTIEESDSVKDEANFLFSVSTSFKRSLQHPRGHNTQ
ncbi:uncharacterized protein TRIADDRAFT_63626 [Trichoplax adhaerens]|uniref:CWH43-like N-terminal domain-containing protein n=1 Tax=Trichoplax adhaerens TaxID=10228 RepID=B3RNC6_TRIAD|nr:hypothetical protein TRIADDRAFT_63626 [Trichoplax adhaerens]EDV27998.1 hypothetical protein TRIADDRAFT_63626 [Trichoplax adhaerens]|eukprot:XP_002109832.1 hypothetical protein TRIADDRAFT_63626 [Trichoplax adhaerens]